MKVLMVTGGRGARGAKAETTVDLLSIDGTKLCSLPSLLAGRDHHSQNGLLVCGGGHWKPGTALAEVAASCDTFSDGKWKRTHTLGHMRQNTPSWASPQGVLLMGGDSGENKKLKYKNLKSTELLTDDGATKPSFPLAYKRK